MILPSIWQLLIFVWRLRFQGNLPSVLRSPNKTTEAVHLRDVLDCSDFKDARGGIPVGLGKDIAGKPVITDLAKMPPCS